VVESPAEERIIVQGEGNSAICTSGIRKDDRVTILRNVETEHGNTIRMSDE
jgi:hypothetical protein